ncbi:MAG: hypothetical protein COB67_11985 [SAR324 cluster bacterium]|uniref:RNA-binding S4 domain-containing protein n=1 Tax=SAR324 cluster bacterium TaxID=2024889 RepID=A0A2A4SRN1_9DELT|nr:MAG: hypothetical protein COB67_11985 [SAR324 cluster bacterium]
MGLHKIRPRLKKYLKIGASLKKDKPLTHKVSASTRIKLYSPDVKYLSSKWTNKLERHYKNKLDERRRLKFYFGFYRTSLLKKILKSAYKKNVTLRNSVKELEFCSVLERRLDVLLYRLGFVPTIFAAKQLISHKKVKVNNYATASFSRLLKKGDVVSFDLSTQVDIHLSLQNHFVKMDLNFTNLNQIEVSFKTLKLIVLTTKINLFSQTQQYSTLLR